MRPLITAVAVLVVFVVAAGLWSPAHAAPAFGPATGATVLLGPPTAGSSVQVDVSVVSETPVVAYEYALVNECYLSGKPSGRADTYQRDDIVNWDASVGDVPHATML